MVNFVGRCYECGNLLDADDMLFGVCDACRNEESDYWEDDDDWEDDFDEDDPYALFEPYYAGDVPDPFDVRVKPARRRFRCWARRKITPFYRRNKWTSLPIRLKRDRRSRSLAGQLLDNLFS